MYSPKVPEHYIPLLYRLGQAKRLPMTHLVAEAVKRYLESEAVSGIYAETGESRPRNAA